MKRCMKLSTLLLALCSLFGFSSHAHDVKSVKAAKGAGDEAWSLIGSVTDPITGVKDTWTKDYNFEYNTEASQYELVFTLNADEEFKIRKDGTWDVQIGYCENTGGGIGDYLINAGDYSKDDYGNALSYANFKVKTTGTYLLKIADNNVANYGDRSYGFSLDLMKTVTFVPSSFCANISNGFSKKEKIVSVVITNDITRRPTGWVESYDVGNHADQLTDDEKNIGCYLYTNVDDSTMYDCVIYANVDIIFANTDSSYMFSDWINLKNIEFDHFNTSRVTNMERMFAGIRALEKLDLSKFDTSNVTTMHGIFSGLQLTSLDVSHFKTQNVTDMSSMFNGCSSLKEIKFYDDPNRNTFITSNVTDMGFMFMGCSALERIDITQFDTSKVEVMYYMFTQCQSLTEIDLSNFSTDSARYLDEMFCMCTSLTSIDVSNFNTKNVENMQAMFAMCSSLTSIDVSNFDTSNVVSMDGMFAYNEGLTSLDLSNFQTPKLEQMIGMFTGCPNLEKLDISNFDLSNVVLETSDTIGGQDVVTGVTYLFDGNNSLKEIKTPSAIREGLTIELPSQYAQIEGGVIVMDSTTTNMILVPGSLELNQLFGDIYDLNTCTDYAQAPALRERYNALSTSDKEAFATLTDKDNVLVSVKLEYMEYMYASNNVTNNSDIHMMPAVYDGSSFLVIMIAVSSVLILGYYLVQKRKYAR